MPREKESAGAECEKPRDGRGAWEEDQAERTYYYDDAHGYEQFDPEEPGDEEDADEKDEKAGPRN